MLDLIYIGIGLRVSGLSAGLSRKPATSSRRKAMDYIIAGLSSVGPVRLPGLRSASAGAFLGEKITMTANGVLQIAVFFGAGARLRQAARRLHGARLRRAAHVPAPGSAMARGTDIQGRGDPRRRRAAMDAYTASLLSFSIFGFLLVYLLQRAQGFLPFNPQHFNAGNVSPGPRLQHRGQLPDQHELAVLRRRIHAELLRADGRADGAELRVRGRRDGDRDRGGARIRPQQKPRPSATSGWT